MSNNTSPSLALASATSAPSFSSPTMGRRSRRAVAKRARETATVPDKENQASPVALLNSLRTLLSPLQSPAQQKVFSEDDYMVSAGDSKRYRVSPEENTLTAAALAAPSFITSSQKKKKPSDSSRLAAGAGRSARNLASYFDYTAGEHSMDSLEEAPSTSSSSSASSSSLVEEEPAEGNTATGGKSGGMFSTLFSPVYHLLNTHGAAGGVEEEEGEECMASSVHGHGHGDAEGGLSLTRYVEFPSRSEVDSETTTEASDEASSQGAVEDDCQMGCDEQLSLVESETAQQAQLEEAQHDDDDVDDDDTFGDDDDDVFDDEDSYEEEVVDDSEAYENSDGVMRLRQPYPADQVEEFDPYWFIALLPPLSLKQRLRPSCLPRKRRGSKPITLVLDLDETLVHCTTEPSADADLRFPVVFNGVEYSVSARLRPYMEHFLQEVSSMFEVVVFTASKQVYADKLLDLLDPERKYIKYRAFRDSCVEVEGNYLKDLTVLGRDLKRTIIVDNSPHAYGFQVDNGIPIESWYDDDHDRELLNLLPFLRKVQGVKDVRPHLRRQFRQRDLVQRYKDAMWKC